MILKLSVSMWIWLDGVYAVNVKSSTYFIIIYFVVYLGTELRLNVLKHFKL